MDSLYRGYPSGSILLWETSESVTEKELKSSATGVSLIKPLYLLDGQQRLTSLHRVFTGHERAQVVFNVLTEKFQIESAATKKDARWVRAQDLLAERSAPSRWSRSCRRTSKSRASPRRTCWPTRPHSQDRHVHVLVGDPR